jgi:16S rRNA (cytosine1402-N4)-methyltransferase
MADQHISVMSAEALEALDIKPEGCYIDATFGRGGHTALILQRLGPNGKLLVIDQDPAAIAVANDTYGNNPQVTVAHGAFSDLMNLVKDKSWPDAALAGRDCVDGVFFDLGVSSPQLDDPARGFSFMRQGPLDMRMDPTRGESVAEYLRTVNAEDLANVLYQYGEERHSRRIARAIVNEASQQPIEDTLQLAAIIKKAHPAWSKKHHPATRSFQALRIAVNDELKQIPIALHAAVDLLKLSGRLVVISFHSLEDRLVKHFIRQQQSAALPSGLPDPDAPAQARLKKIGGMQSPSEEEIKQNPRSRSARMRVAKKL